MNTPSFAHIVMETANRYAVWPAAYCSLGSVSQLIVWSYLQYRL